MLRCLSLSPQDGVTPLRMASGEGHEEVVRLLLQSGSHQQPGQVRETISSIVHETDPQSILLMRYLST